MTERQKDYVIKRNGIVKGVSTCCVYFRGARAGIMPFDDSDAHVSLLYKLLEQFEYGLGPAKAVHESSDYCKDNGFSENSLRFRFGVVKSYKGERFCTRFTFAITTDGKPFSNMTEDFYSYEEASCLSSSFDYELPRKCFEVGDTFQVQGRTFKVGTQGHVTEVTGEVTTEEVEHG